MAKKGQRNMQKPRKITSITELRGKNDVIEFPVSYDGEDVLIEARVLSYKRWKDIAEMVERPKVPARPKEDNIGQWYDEEDPEYIEKLEDWSEEVALLRVADSLVTEIPGKDLQEKRDYLSENVTGGFISAVHAALTIKQGEGSIELDRLASFLKVRRVGTEDSESVGEDT